MSISTETGVYRVAGTIIAVRANNLLPFDVWRLSASLSLVS